MNSKKTTYTFVWPDSGEVLTHTAELGSDKAAIAEARYMQKGLRKSIHVWKGDDYLLSLMWGAKDTKLAEIPHVQ